jgi:hypothetical protein
LITGQHQQQHHQEEQSSSFHDDYNDEHNDDDGKNSAGYRKWSNAFWRELLKFQRRSPLLKRMLFVIQKVPPKQRWAFVLVWILWKVVALVITLRVVYMASGSANTSNNMNNDNPMLSSRRSMAYSSFSSQSTTSTSPPLKILYIVTSLTEYNTGTRMTTKGQDRLAEVLLPVLVDSIDSMIHPPYYYQVDVYLILGFTLRPERQDFIASRLPSGVGLQVWDDASPLGYDGKHDANKILDNTRTLSRQHRYVIKDKLPYYDFFIAMEDDMRITGDHVHHFLQVSHQLDRLRASAPTSVASVPENMNPLQQRYFGAMTQRQLSRLIPGFIRVEVLLNETAHGAQTKLDPVPLDYQFPVTTTTMRRGSSTIEQHLDPTICCHVHMNPNKETPVHPTASDVIIWETSVKALSLRQLPQLPPTTTSSSSSPFSLDWVVLLPGPGKRLPPEELMGGYWSGRDGAFDQKPSPGMPDLIAQQGGWMATKSQIQRLVLDQLCQGSFLPPYDEPMYYKDGQESMNVEFWSGGYQLFTGVRGGCNMQRIISFTPEHFSKSLICKYCRLYLTCIRLVCVRERKEARERERKRKEARERAGYVVTIFTNQVLRAPLDLSCCRPHLLVGVVCDWVRWTLFDHGGRPCW